VQFGAIMEMARAHTPPQNRRDRLVRTILLTGLLPHRGRMAVAGAAFRTVQALRVPAVLRTTGVWRALPLGKFAAFPPPVDRSPLPAALPEVMAAQGIRRARVGLLTGCIQDQLFRSTNRRTALALAANGCQVVIPRDQLCCGALASHAGEATTAAQLAAHTLDVFTRAGVDAVVVNAAGCGSNMKEYGLQLRSNPPQRQAGEVFSHTVRDASEFLAGLGPLRAPKRGIKLRVAYQDACHLLHGQRIARQPREMLAAISGIELVDLKEADWCCGSAGVYNLTHPDMAEAALAWKVEHILESGAEVVASANPGCIMQIAMGLQRAGHDIPVVHVMDLLGWAYGDPGPAPRLIAQRFAT
jgi:glycolate oxidase iron-sulfur subunit